MTCIELPPAYKEEWLETDGQGGYALGTCQLLRTRKYHSWYCYASKPPIERHGGLKHLEVVVREGATELYRSPALFYQNRNREISEVDVEFVGSPWPRWKIPLTDTLSLIQEYLMFPESRSAVFCWSLEGHPGGAHDLTLDARFFISDVDHHQLYKGRVGTWTQVVEADELVLQYEGTEFPLRFSGSGRLLGSPEVYHDFYYPVEDVRGYESKESLFSPGYMRCRLGGGEKQYLLVTCHRSHGSTLQLDEVPQALDRERQRRSDAEDFRSSQFIVSTHERSSVIAGYPWFTDWGRDTFIALRGLCLETGRVHVARDILCAWAQYIDRGMIPNRFPDESPCEYNSVDASLWYVVSAYAYLDIVQDHVRTTVRRIIEDAIDAIIEGYRKGTRYNIGCDDDGLIYAGERGYALTWMDARYEGVPITPRIGKPVEIQALWLNILARASQKNESYKRLFEIGCRSFYKQFYSASMRQLYDVVQVNGSDEKDASFRPNQLFALGGLPFALLDQGDTQGILDRVDEELLTPYGLRTLSNRDAAYCPRYEGSLKDRDAAYHQGTVWPWLLGVYLESSLRAGRSPQRLGPAMHQLQRVFADRAAGMTPEVYDGSEPHRPCGCPFQAWTLAEYIRAAHLLGIEV